MAKKRQREAKREKTKVFIVDDHPMVRERLAQLINREPDLSVCGEAEDAPQALESIGQLNPDIAIVDLSLKDTHGLELIKDLRERQPQLPVLVLSMHDESLYAERVLRAGAKGYITKQEATQKVMSAIRSVLKGGIYLSEKMSAQMLRTLAVGQQAPGCSPLDLLSDRELEIFQMIGQGHGTRKIAGVLRLGIKTVESYRSRIKEKLNLADSTSLLQHAVHWVQSGGRH